MRGIHIIQDGNNSAYRANCTTELYTRDGKRTSAIVGTLNIAHSVAEQLADKLNLPVKEIIFTWDLGHSKRRTDIFPEYKGNRQKERTEEEQEWMSEFIEQANTLYEQLPLFGMKCVRKKGCEGDDLVLGLCNSLEEKYPEDINVIVSTDEDFHQLISENTYLYSPIKQILYTLDNYEELTGIKQELFLTYKVLKGDSSDGINGIAGIGEKTAKSLVNEYGNLDSLLASKDALVKSKRTAKIFTPEGLGILARNNQLINLRDYVDTSEFQDEIDEVISEEPYVDEKAAKAFLMKYQLVSLLTKWKTWSELFKDIEENFNC